MLISTQQSNGFAANGFFPDFVESSAAIIYRLSGNGRPSAALTPDAARFLAPLVGMLLAVLALAAVQLVKLVTPRSSRRAARAGAIPASSPTA